MSNYNNHGAQVEFFAYKNSNKTCNALQITIKHPNQFTSENALGYIIVFKHQLTSTSNVKIEFYKLNYDGSSTIVWAMT